MRTLLVFLLGLLIGAAAFHAFYMRLAPPDRCTWDHPLSEGARQVCRETRAGTSYDAAARHALNRLIENVGE